VRRGACSRGERVASVVIGAFGGVAKSRNRCAASSAKAPQVNEASRSSRQALACGDLAAALRIVGASIAIARIDASTAMLLLTRLGRWE